jgi:hypothetical protein
MSISSLSNEPWSPRRLPGLLHWFRFRTAIKAQDDGNVTLWRDDAGGLEATADGAANNSPDLQSDGTIQFNHASNVLQFKSGGSSTNIVLGEFAMYWKLNWLGSDTIGAEDLIESDGNNFFKLTSPTTARYKISGTRHDFTFEEIREGTPFVVGAERNSEGGISVHVDNASAEADEGEGAQTTGDTITLSQFGKPTSTSYWYEVVICNQALSTANRNLLYEYLSNI